MTAPADQPHGGAMPVRTAVLMFLGFALGYFLSALLRAVTATLAPVLSAELGLSPGDLGLLGSMYFLGFAAMQLPLGAALDRFGPRRVQLMFLAVATAGTCVFAVSSHLWSLALARVLIGIGVSACLMAPLTTYRRHFSAGGQLRASSWMLMTGSLGMLSSTLPVQLLLPAVGWRGVFWGVAVLLVLAAIAVSIVVPPDHPTAARDRPEAPQLSYGAIYRHPLFVRYLPIICLHFGTLFAVQTLWAGPWLNRVSGWPQEQTAQALFALNLSMMLMFMSWGALMPRLQAHGWTPHRLVAWITPLSLAALCTVIGLGARAHAVHWILFCIMSTPLALTQTAVGQAFPAAQAGRALTAYNLMIFVGTFVMQWSIGLLVDGLQHAGWSTVDAFRGAFAAVASVCALAYLWFLHRRPGAREDALPRRGVAP